MTIMQRQMSPHMPIVAPITAPAMEPALSEPLLDEQELKE